MSFIISNFVTHSVMSCTSINIIILPQSLQWGHNERDGVSNHQPHGCLLNRLFRRRSKKTSKLRLTGLCAGNSPATGEFPAQMASNAENVSIWWLHHDSPYVMITDLYTFLLSINDIYAINWHTFGQNKLVCIPVQHPYMYKIYWLKFGESKLICIPARHKLSSTLCTAGYGWEIISVWNMNLNVLYGWYISVYFMK